MTLNRLPAIFGIFFFIFLLQEAILNRVNFLVGGFSLYLAFFMAWIMQDERNSAVATGFIAGFILDLSPTLEAPFGLWTLVLTGMSYILATNVRAALDSELSPVVMTMVTVLGSSVALILFLLFGAILGQDVGSGAYVTQVIFGNAMWSLLLSPLYVPITVALYRATLTARNR
ncbi:MAG: rod shape-determining protein MreD [Candidatus Nanopelagicaceae bacterium]